MVDRAAALAGVRDVAPMLLGVAPFGLVVGVAAIEAGFPVEVAVAMSVVVFAGAAQLALIDLVGQGAAPAVAAGTALVVNLRYLMYSASIAPQLGRYSARWRTVLSYLMTDQAYALSVVRDGPVRAYYLGAALLLWVVWQATTITGVVVGAAIPASWNLSFAVPLTFLALLVPAVEGRPTLGAAVVGGTVATVGVGLPFNLGLLAGALSGIAAGAAVALRTEDDPIAGAADAVGDHEGAGGDAAAPDDATAAGDGAPAEGGDDDADEEPGDRTDAGGEPR
jgi:predicted branched-subunit amino acid permease